MPCEPSDGTGSRTVAVFWQQVVTWLRNAAMDIPENYDSFIGNQSALGLHIHRTMDTLVMTLYFLVILCFGLWTVLSHSRGTIKDFFLAGQNLTWWLMGTSVYSANIGSGHHMSMAGLGAASGVAVGALEWNMIFMFFVLGWIFVPIYSKAEVVTLPEYLRKRFGSVRIQLFLSVFFIIIYIFSQISMEISFGAMFLKTVWNIDIYQTILILLAITGVYTITGGLVTVTYVETLQAAIMIFGSALLTSYAFQKVGGYQGMVDKYFQAIPSVTQEGNWTAKPQCFLPRPDSFHIFRSCVSGDIPWPGLMLGSTTVSLFYGCADQVSVQRFLAGKSRLHMRGGCLLCGYLKLLPMFFMVMPGMISRILYTDQVACAVPSECQKFCGRQTGCSFLAYPMLVLGLMPSGLQGFLLFTVCAALMSSLTAIYNSSSALFTLNIYTWMRPSATEKELMVAGRFFIILLLAITIVLVPVIELAPSEMLFEYIQVLKSCLTPSVTAVFVLAVFCKRVNEQGAFWGLVSGTAVGLARLLADFFYRPLTCEGRQECPILICGLHHLYFGFLLFLVTLLATLVISSATKPIPDEHLHGICWSLRHSRQRRVTLDKDLRWKILPSFSVQPGMFGEAHTCLWKFWDLYCGLDTQPYSKTGPDNTTEEKTEAIREQLGSSGRSVGLEMLARRMAAIKAEENRAMARDWSDMPESPFWKRVLNASAILLTILVIFAHVYYA